MEYGLFRKRHKKKKPLQDQERKELILSLFRFKDADTSTSGFSSECLIGRCILAELYQATLKDGTRVIIKRGIRRPSRHYPAQLAIANELRILTALNNDAKHGKSYARLIGLSHSLDRLDPQSIGRVHTVDPATSPGETLLVLEYPFRGALFNVLHRSDPADPLPPLCLPLRIHLAFEIAKCVKTLHYRHEIVHRDLRSTNVWIDKDWSVRLANFSLALDIPWDDPMPDCPLGSPGMLDPDWPKDGYLATKVDVYCFGILLVEIISNRKVFDGSNVPCDLVGWIVPLVRKNHFLSIVDPRLHLLPDHLKIPREFGKIAAMCLNPVSRRRPTMSDVLERLRPLKQQFPFTRR